MEGVEILVEVEAAFGITLDDRSAERVVTVGDLCELVLSIVPGAKQERCLSALAFWRLRAALGSLGVERARVRPDARLEELLWTGEQDAASRRAVWDHFAAALGLDLPPLVRSRRLVLVCTTLSLGAFAVALGWGPFPWWEDAWVAAALSIGVSCLLGALTRPYRAYPPPEVATVGDLARQLVVGQAAKVAAPTGGFTRPQVEATVTGSSQSTRRSRWSA